MLEALNIFFKPVEVKVALTTADVLTLKTEKCKRVNCVCNDWFPLN